MEQKVGQMTQPHLRRRIRKKSWIERNLKYITIILCFLFLIKFFQGCLVKSSYQKNLINVQKNADSISKTKDQQILVLQNQLSNANDSIKDLYYELKIQHIQVDAAEKRATAIQNTAEKIKTNTTIKIEADTSKNKVH